VAERRPSYYLAANRKALDALTDDHLDLLANANLIPRDLAERAKAVELRGPGQRVDPPPPSFVEQKAANALRIRVAALLGDRACTTSTGSTCRFTPRSTSRRSRSSAASCKAWPNLKPR
jgi:membrane peptidoglycan carboxypeptidase